MTFLIFLPGMFVLGEHNTMRELNDKVPLSLSLSLYEQSVLCVRSGMFVLDLPALSCVLN
jgi:hypothetical protein